MISLKRQNDGIFCVLVYSWICPTDILWIRGRRYLKNDSEKVSTKGLKLMLLPN